MAHPLRPVRMSAATLLLFSALTSITFLSIGGCNSTPPPDTANRADSGKTVAASQSHDTLARFLASVMSDTTTAEDVGEQQCRWTYPEMTGSTNNWVRAGCRDCGSGQRFTSPIALNPATAQPVDGALPYDLNPPSLTVNLNRFEQDNNYAFNVGPPLTISWSLNNQVAVTWKLVDFHFHSAAEHTVVGYPAAMEMHVKATAQNGGMGTAVFTVRFAADTAGAGSTLLQGVARAIAGQPGQTFDITAALTPFTTEPSYFYPGSLTTPPCSGPIYFYVLESPISVDSSSLASISASLIALNKGWPNVRPVQQYSGSVFRLVSDIASS